LAEPRVAEERALQAIIEGWHEARRKSL